VTSPGLSDDTGGAMTHAASLDELLAEIAARAEAPPAEWRALPPGIYHSGSLAALEQERIFARDWLSPGLAAEIPEPGDYMTFSLGTQEIVTLRGEDGVVRSFANVCRHRMMRLVEGRGRCKRLVCPYHAWTYDLDGRLVGAPYMDRSPGFDKGRIRLGEIRTEVWEGWIYVTLDPAAPSIADALEALRPLVGPYRMAGYRPVIRQDHVWDTNWKLLTENFMEGYHLPVAHRRTVGAWFPAEETAFPEAVHEAFTYQTFIKDETARYGLAHRDNTSLQGRWRKTSVMPTIYPSHMYVLAPDHLWYLSLRPKGVGQVQVRFGVALAPEVLDDLQEPEAALAELEAFFDRVNAEDRRVTEGLMLGTAGPHARPGPCSWLERELHDFAGYLARRLAGRADNVHELRQVRP